MFEKLLQEKDLNKVAKTVKKLKQWIKNRDEMHQHTKQEYKDLIKSNQIEADNSKNKTMKKIFSVPVDIYMGNPEYWDDIIKNRKFDKHPEWKIKQKNKIFTV